MTADTPFLRAIYARPLDPLPRLIYADFLDEQGRVAEAAWLRADVRLWQAPEDADPDDRRLVESEPGPEGVMSLALARSLAAVPWVAAMLFVSLGQSLAAALRGLLPGRPGGPGA
jgi:uncharacterized protein (TIGR02996 family)